MPIQALLLPVFVQVLLTLIVMLRMGQTRSASLAASRTHPNKKDVALGTHTWNEDATKAANNFSNQFEIPVLFYAVVAFALIVKQHDIVMVALAWIFVLLRVVHAAIHIGPNVVAIGGEEGAKLRDLLSPPKPEPASAAATKKA